MIARLSFSKWVRLFGVGLLLLLTCACSGQAVDDPIVVSEVSPWCIIGFDSLKRTPAQRIDLLQELGFHKYGFNKGDGDLTTMVEEFELAEANDIEIPSIFLWLNAKRDTIGKLSPANQELLQNLSLVAYKPTIWLSMSSNFYEGKSHEQSLALAIEIVKYIKLEAGNVGSPLALYNHGGWFGDPYNQVELLKALDDESVSIVYNFHHANEDINDFRQIAKAMQPYLSYINLSGVSVDGPEILTLGQGDHEVEMVQGLMAAGYDGPWGILGHVKTEDVEVVLKRNLEGLEEINARLGVEAAE